MAPESAYKILRNAALGRYMVANKKLKQGELIFRESAAMVGSQLNGPAKCFRCLKTINLLRCSFCNGCNTALVCQSDCKGKLHCDDECLVLKTQKIKGQIIAENPAVIFPLRCLLLSYYNEKLFDEILRLEAHMDKRRDTPIWRRHRINVEAVLKETQLLTEEELKAELLQRICGILDINSYEVRPPYNDLAFTNPDTQCLRAVYPKAALMAHSCISNTHIAVDDSFVISIYAKVDIEPNELILSNYANVLQGTRDRQECLMEGKCFSCQCRRCQDPTELGTEISSLVCHKCRKGFLRYQELEPNFKTWKCSECGVCYKDFLIHLAIDESRRRIDELDLGDIGKMEDLYKRLLPTLHPNHYLLLELKQQMVALYSKLPHTKTNLNRKIDLCGRLMSVYSKIEPGISRIRALCMYELQSAIVDISNKQYADNEIRINELIKELETAEKILKEAVKYLLYEPVQSPEGRMAQMTLIELKMLRQSIKNIQSDNSTTNGEESKKAEITKRLKDKLEKKEGKKSKNKSKKSILT